MEDALQEFQETRAPLTPKDLEELPPHLRAKMTGVPEGYKKLSITENIRDKLRGVGEDQLSTPKKGKQTRSRVLESTPVRAAERGTDPDTDDEKMPADQQPNIMQLHEAAPIGFIPPEVGDIFSRPPSPVRERQYFEGVWVPRRIPRRVDTAHDRKKQSYDFMNVDWDTEVNTRYDTYQTNRRKLDIRRSIFEPPKDMIQTGTVL